MDKSTSAIAINWPQKALFHFVCDLDNAAFWQSNVVDADWVGEQRHTVGALFNELQITNDKLAVLCKEVTASSPYESRSVSWHEKGLEITQTLAFGGAGEYTRVTSVLEIRPANDGLESVGEVKELIHKRTVEDMERLKQLLEDEIKAESCERADLEGIAERTNNFLLGESC